MSAMDIDGASNSGKEHAQQEAAAQPSPGPMTPAFLLQLIKLLRRKENLLGKVSAALWVHTSRGPTSPEGSVTASRRTCVDAH